MTVFPSETRHYCRNPRCRSKLSAPVSNPREAFCTRGCHAGFYRNRCLVCEGQIERRAANQKICRKAKCRNALRQGSGFGRFFELSQTPSAAKRMQEVPDFIDPKQPLKADRPWRIVAGPELSSASFRVATLPLDRATAVRAERDVAALREHIRRLSAKAHIQPHHAPINVLGGQCSAAAAVT